MTIKRRGFGPLFTLSAAGLVLGACVAAPPPAPYRNDPPYQATPLRPAPVYQPPYRNDAPYRAPSANDGTIFEDPSANRPIRNDDRYASSPGRDDDRYSTDPDGDGDRTDDRRPNRNPPRDTRPDGNGDRGDDRRPPSQGRPDRDGNGDANTDGNRGDDRRPRDNRTAGATRPQGGSCDASAAASFIGQKATKAVLADMRRATGAKAIRAAGPDTAVTMDFSPDRLTVELDSRGRVVRASCN